jgi:hypothetical protein
LEVGWKEFKQPRAILGGYFECSESSRYMAADSTYHSKCALHQYAIHLI